jgi:hypothetical protein
MQEANSKYDAVIAEANAKHDSIIAEANERSRVQNESLITEAKSHVKHQYFETSGCLLLCHLSGPKWPKTVCTDLRIFSPSREDFTFSVFQFSWS